MALVRTLRVEIPLLRVDYNTEPERRHKAIGILGISGCPLRG
jgi:hypothetical protein